MDLLTYVLLKKQIAANTNTAYNLKGSLASKDELPVDAQPGDAYIIDGETYVKTSEDWIKTATIHSDDTSLETGPGKSLGLKGFLDANVGDIAIKGADGKLQWSNDLKNLKTLVGSLPTSSKSTSIVEYVDEKIKNITLNGVSLVDDNGTIDIPIATETNLGAVKGSKEISIANNGALNIQQMDVTKLS